MYLEVDLTNPGRVDEQFERVSLASEMKMNAIQPVVPDEYKTKE